MDVEWDPLKAASNITKHGVAFADAATVLDDSLALTIEDKRFGEQRFVTIGKDARGRILVAVYVYPATTDTVRLLSARRATTSEKKQYHDES